MKLGFLLSNPMAALDFEACARWGAEQGFQAMDVPPDQAGTRAICDRYGLQVNCTSDIYANPLSADDRERELQIDLINGAIDLATSQGVPCLCVGHRRDPSVNAEDNLRLFQLAYEPLAAYAEQQRVKLVFEKWPNRGQNLMSTPELWDRTFNAVPSPALGLLIDPSHCVWMGIDYLRATRDFGERIYHAHAKDTELLAEGQYRYGIYGAQVERSAWWRYRLPGFGVVDWPRFLDTLYQIGFDGVISIEHEDSFWGFGMPGDVERQQRGLVLAKQTLAPLIV